MIFNIIDSLGSIATVGAFLWLFKRDKDKQSQIDALTKLSTTASERLRYSVFPDIRFEDSSSNPAQGRINIGIKNHGEYAKLVSFTLLEANGVILDNQSNKLPYRLDNEKSRIIFLLSNGLVNLNEATYVLRVIYADKIGNNYSVDMTGTGPNVIFGFASLTND